MLVVYIFYFHFQSFRLRTRCALIYHMTYEYEILGIVLNDWGEYDVAHIHFYHYTFIISLDQYTLTFLLYFLSNKLDKCNKGILISVIFYEDSICCYKFVLDFGWIICQCLRGIKLKKFFTISLGPANTLI